MFDVGDCPSPVLVMLPVHSVGGYSIFACSIVEIKLFYLCKMKIQEINKLADIYLKLSEEMIDHDKYTYYAITHHSTAIEGSTLTEKQSVNLLEYGKPAALKLNIGH